VSSAVLLGVYGKRRTWPAREIQIRETKLLLKI
jgi:hypothetical protein